MKVNESYSQIFQKNQMFGLVILCKWTSAAAAVVAAVGPLLSLFNGVTLSLPI